MRNQALLACFLLVLFFAPYVAAQCGSAYGGATCTSLSFPNDCCSQYGYCGTGSAYCGTGCQPAASAGHCTSSTAASTTTSSTTKSSTTSTSTTKSATTGTSTTTTTTGSTTGGSSTWPVGPLKAVYLDLYNGESVTATATAAINAGFNLLILGFWVGAPTSSIPVGPNDAAAYWQALGSSAQRSFIATAHSKNVKITVSGGGATDNPYNSYTGTAYGQAVANFAVANNLDGVDFDLEHIGVGFKGGSLTAAQTVTWIENASLAARAILGASNNTISGRLITHAPQAPYFGQTSYTTSSASYSVIYNAIPTVIDYLFVQYYDQGSCYTECTSLFTNGNSCSAGEPGTAVNQIVAAGVPISKVIVGADVETDSPPVPASTYCGCFHGATTYNQGIMIYRWLDDGYTGTFLNAVYSC